MTHLSRWSAPLIDPAARTLAPPRTAWAALGTIATAIGAAVILILAIWGIFG